MAISIILGFTSQLCVQLGYNNLGLLILLTNAAVGLISSLFAPAFFAKFNARKVILIVSFGIT